MSNSKPQALLQVFIPLTGALAILLVLVHAFVQEKAKGWRHWSALPMHAIDVDL
jgi:cell division protein FtsW (lipid II flippase)